MTPSSTTASARSPGKLHVGTAILHLGGVQFPISGPIRYTMTAADAVEVCRLIKPHTAIPIHYEGWKHFRQGRDAIEAEFAPAPEDIRSRVRWLPIGEAVEIPVERGRTREPREPPRPRRGWLFEEGKPTAR